VRIPGAGLEPARLAARDFKSLASTGFAIRVYADPTGAATGMPTDESHHGRYATGMPNEAGNGTRTRDPNLGKVVLYQLSYSRN
jgi:hypothetical protein